MRGATGNAGHLTDWVALVAVACSWGATGLAADKPAEKLTVKRLVPSGAAAGGTVVVKAEGTFPRWPVRVWTNRGGTTWKPRAEKGSFDVTVTAEGIGTHSVRIHDDSEAASLHRFVVGTIPEASEAEPNDRPQQPQAVSTLPLTINGVLEKTGDVDGYGIHLDAGQTLVAAIDAHGGLSAPIDAVLEVVDDRGNYLARNLDARGLDPRIIFRPLYGGRYVVRVYGFPADPNATIGYSGGANHIYRLTLTTSGYLAATLPTVVSRSGSTSATAVGWNLPAGLAPLPLNAPQGDTIWAAFPGVAGAVPLPIVEAQRLPVASTEATAPIEPPLVASGLFTAADQPIVVRITAKKAQPLLVTVEANTVGSEAEAVLDVRGADGSSPLSKSDHDPPAVWTPPADGDYLFTVRDRRGVFGPGHFFRLTVVPSQPQLVAICESESVAGKIGGAIDLAIAVERLRGWKEPVEFVLVDPQTGITADPVVSEADGESAKKVTLKLKATAAFNGPVAVQARRRGSADGAATPVTAVRFGKEKLPVVWVSIAP